jgi:hypothetical protein
MDVLPVTIYRVYIFLSQFQIPIIFTVILYGCEAWSLTLREEHRLRVFENRVLRGIFGPKEMK